MNSQRGRFGRKVERYLQKDEGPKPQLAANKQIQSQIEKLQSLTQKRHKQVMKAITKAAR